MTKEQKYCIESYSIVLLDIKRNFFLILFHIVKPMRTTKRCQRKVVFSSFVERTSGGINRISHAILRCSSWVLINMLFKKKGNKNYLQGALGPALDYPHQNFQTSACGRYSQQLLTIFSFISTVFNTYDIKQFAKFVISTKDEPFVSCRFNNHFIYLEKELKFCNIRK